MPDVIKAYGQMYGLVYMLKYTFFEDEKYNILSSTNERGSLSAEKIIFFDRRFYLLNRYLNFAFF